MPRTAVTAVKCHKCHATASHKTGRDVPATGGVTLHCPSRCGALGMVYRAPDGDVRVDGYVRPIAGIDAGLAWSF